MKPTIGKLEDGSNLAIDVERLSAGRLLISAQSGAGKSWALRRLLEQTYGLIPQIIIDREGEFYTLREKFDYLLAGGEGSDCAADVRSAALLARKILELRLSAIVDIEPLPGPQRHEFVQRFVGALIDAPKRLRTGALVVLDEADQFAAESGGSGKTERAESRRKVIELASLGRKRGLVPCFATQRLSKLSKDVAAECANRLVGRTTLDTDAKRAIEELGFEPRAGRAALRGLDDGEFFAYGPALSAEVAKIKVSGVRTNHPRPGAPLPPTPEPRDAVKRVLAELADLPERAAEEARDLAAASQRIRELERELRKAQKGAAPPDEKLIERERAAARRGAEDQLASERRQSEARNARVIAAIEEITAVGGKVVELLRAASDVEPPPRRARSETSDRRRPTPPARSAPSIDPSSNGAAQVSARSGEVRMLAVLAQHAPSGLREATWAALSSLKRSGGTWSTYRSRLTTRGLIRREGDLYFATDEGLDAAGVVPERPQTTEEVVEMWRSKPGMAPAVRLVEAALEYPDGIEKLELAEACGLTAGAGTFGTYLSRAKTAGLLEVEGSVVRPASALLDPLA